MEKVRPLTNRQKDILNDYFQRSIAGETMEEIASSHGISRKTLYTWKKSKEGKQLYADFRKDLSSDDIGIFYDVLREKMLSGSFKHMELYVKINKDKFGLDDKQSQAEKNDDGERIKQGLSTEELAELESLLNEVPLKRVK